jgi:hypothetical protein
MPRGRPRVERTAASGSTRKTRRPHAQSTTEKKLREWLVLNAFVNDLFGMKDFSDFHNLLADAEEGYDENGQSYFFQRLKGQQGLKIPVEKLEAYEANIKKHLDHINARRDMKISLKYFQYLAVLFTEVYLDRYFTEGEGRLAGALERSTTAFIDAKQGIDPVHEYERFVHSLDDIRRISFWMATGSGKTLLFHLHYLQFMEYNRGPHRLNFDNVLLITPDERLTAQHLREMRLSAIPGEQFSGTSVTGYFTTGPSDSVKVIDIHKLTEEKTGQGGVSVDIEHFGSKNLVFIDEAHRGTGGQKWKYFRTELAKEGFAFEYSATIGQAVAAAQPREATQEDPFARYAKSILFDYSYPHFYKDGYGKEFRLLNLKQESYNARDTLLCANLLAYFQQKLVIRKNPAIISDYHIREPLWIFVGNKVNVSSERSDILVIVQFLDKFTRDRPWALQTLSDILKGRSGLQTPDGHDVFDPDFPDHRLKFILDSGYDIDNPDTLYREILEEVFHSTPGTPLTLVNLKGTEGEIGMRYGDNQFFGLIYVGDSSKFIKLVGKAAPNIIVPPAIDHPSLFETIESSESRINLLVGAKKFGLGWDTFRVSSMGLMRMGQGEGAEIIQLFGRGVRLKGKNNSLKRTTSQDTDRPKYLNLVETLNIFALGADYLEMFKGFLEKEGIDPGRKFFPLNIRLQREFFNEGLIVPKIKKAGFEESARLIITHNDVPQVTINLIAHVATIDSDAYDGMDADRRNEPVSIPQQYIPLLDWDRIYYDLVESIAQKGYFNIVFTKDLLHEIITSRHITLYCSPKLVEPKSFPDLDTFTDVVTTVLKKALVSAISKKKSAWLMENLEVESLSENHDNFAFKHYCIMINEDETDIIESVKKITKEELERFCSRAGGRFITNIYFDHHLFQPLLALENEKTTKLQIQPTGLVASERKFVERLRDYIDHNPDAFSHQKVFLLRNQPRNGVGFFRTVWFYPDFIIWIKDIRTGKQRIIFVDPKGIAHIENGFENEKVALASDIRRVRDRIAVIRGNEDIELESFIVADNTRAEAKPIFSPKHPDDYENHHVEFLSEERCIPAVLGVK